MEVAIRKVARDAGATRKAIMDAAEALIYDQGFAATSVDDVIGRAGLTKGAFFHHFRSKADLAFALVVRFAERDGKILDRFLARVERLSRDPVQQVLLFAALFEDELIELGRPVAGCLFATYCYEAGIFDDKTLATISEGFQNWRRQLSEKFRRALECCPPKVPVSADELADMASALFQGGLVLSKGMEDSQVLIAQVRQYRNYLELLFGTSLSVKTEPPAAA